jgi:hypothetical protein
MEIGESVTYMQLTSILGWNPRDTGIIGRARKIVLRECGHVFEVDRGVGLTRTDETGKMGVVRSNVRKISNRARDSAEILNSVQFDKLDESGRASFAVNAAVVQAIASESSGEKYKRLRKVAEASPVGSFADIAKLLGPPSCQ